jgi:hypothetical protein
MRDGVIASDRRLVAVTALPPRLRHTTERAS